EQRQRGVAAADGGVVLEDPAEAALSGEAGERGAGIGDGGEAGAVAAGGPPGVRQQGGDLEGLARLGRDDDERVVEGGAGDGGGVGGVENREASAGGEAPVH